MEEDDRRTDAHAAPAADLEDTARDDARRDARLGPGTVVGGYVIDGEIGKGGMGFVYSATHPVIGKRAAIKVLKPEVSRSLMVVNRFIQEARAVNQIQHPNIIDIFAFGALDDGRAYHIMDLLVGESLRKRLRRGPLHPSEAASVIEETALALTAAHEKGFVHRDLKPDNIFLQTREGRWPEVKLLDFGLAKLMPEAGESPFQTKTGVMVGTPEYMSPEQARGQSVDYRTDVYALGIMMFEILAGERPFRSLGDSFSTLMQHAETPAPSLADFRSDLPVEMIQLVDAMLAKEPGARPSLAAVRTVIKRLRSTALPTHTAALDISRSTSRPPIAPDDPLALTPSHLGAAPSIPSLPSAAPLPSAPSLPPHRSVPPGASQPNLAPHHSYPPGANPAASQPRLAQPGPSTLPPTHGGASSPAIALPPTHGGASSPAIALPPTHGGTSNPGISLPSTYGRPATPAASGLASSDAVGRGTVLGVGKLKPPTQPPQPAPPPASSKLWIVLGAVLAIAAGVALALVAVG